MFPEVPPFIEPSEYDVSVINALLGIEASGYPLQESLPTNIDLTALWHVIAATERDSDHYPFDREIFWGLDLSDDELTVTEITIGHALGVSQERDHLIGVHTHPRPTSRSPFVVDDNVEVAPSEMAYFLDNHRQYFELVFNRSPERKAYPCTLALKTQGTIGVRYGNNESMKQELSLQSGLLHDPFWRRERAFHDRCDTYAQEKHIALYRGSIVRRSTDQLLLTLVP